MHKNIKSMDKLQETVFQEKLFIALQLVTIAKSWSQLASKPAIFFQKIDLSTEGDR